MKLRAVVRCAEKHKFHHSVIIRKPSGLTIREGFLHFCTQLKSPAAELGFLVFASANQSDLMDFPYVAAGDFSQQTAGYLRAMPETAMNSTSNSAREVKHG
ncbi:hypothetical protein DSL62_08895 [Pantoea sp. 3_1284]|nr:hypothetical protein DSL62_08895 [Pantoea sp. 3_1284]